MKIAHLFAVCLLTNSFAMMRNTIPERQERTTAVAINSIQPNISEVQQKVTQRAQAYNPARIVNDLKSMDILCTVHDYLKQDDKGYDPSKEERIRKQALMTHYEYSALPAFILNKEAKIALRHLTDFADSGDSQESSELLFPLLFVAFDKLQSLLDKHLLAQYLVEKVKQLNKGLKLLPDAINQKLREVLQKILPLIQVKLIDVEVLDEQGISLEDISQLFNEEDCKLLVEASKQVQAVSLDLGVVYKVWNRWIVGQRRLFYEKPTPISNLKLQIHQQRCFNYLTGQDLELAEIQAQLKEEYIASISLSDPKLATQIIKAAHYIYLLESSMILEDNQLRGIEMLPEYQLLNNMGGDLLSKQQRILVAMKYFHKPYNPKDIDANCPLKNILIQAFDYLIKTDQIAQGFEKTLHECVRSIASSPDKIYIVIKMQEENPGANFFQILHMFNDFDIDDNSEDLS